ncbi:MAG: hypothetical protein WDO73_27925 [Ignavibacteriota bacterium]
MRILITGICGFAGTAVAEALLERREGVAIFGIDNLHRPGSELNRIRLRKRGVKFIQGRHSAGQRLRSVARGRLG